MRNSALAISIVALALGVGCEKSTLTCPEGSIPVSDSGKRAAYCAPVCTDAGACTCPTDWVSIWNNAGHVAECAPACGSNGPDGGCPNGSSCRTCLASGDCPACDVCVAACTQPP